MIPIDTQNCERHTTTLTTGHWLYNEFLYSVMLILQRLEPNLSFDHGEKYESNLKYAQEKVDALHWN